MKFRLLPLITVFTLAAIGIGLVANSLRSKNVEYSTSPNEFRFESPELADLARALDFTFHIEKLEIHVAGLRANFGISGACTADMLIEIRGQTMQTLPGLKTIWPVSKIEFERLITDQISERIGGAKVTVDSLRSPFLPLVE